jgi:hypothetical protein
MLLQSSLGVLVVLHLYIEWFCEGFGDIFFPVKRVSWSHLCVHLFALGLEFVQAKVENLLLLVFDDT